MKPQHNEEREEEVYGVPSFPSIGTAQQEIKNDASSKHNNPNQHEGDRCSSRTTKSNTKIDNEKMMKSNPATTATSVITKVSDHMFEIGLNYKEGMRVPGRIISNRKLDNGLLHELYEFMEGRCDDGKTAKDNDKDIVTDSKSKEEGEKNNNNSDNKSISIMTDAKDKQRQQQEEREKQNIKEIIELKERRKGLFLPSIEQIANVASLPGIVKGSYAMPDVHSGYGFCIGNVAAMDVSNQDAVVSPGGVGFDINCGVRLIRTNLTQDEHLTTNQIMQQLVQALFDHIPVGSRQRGKFTTSFEEMDQILDFGIDWALVNGYAWPEDKELCEEYGRDFRADSSKVSNRAKKRGLSQLGTLGGGNHYCEIQVVDHIYDPINAKRFGLTKKGQVCIMIHSGSRGLGHQVATDALLDIEKRKQQKQRQRQQILKKKQENEGRNHNDNDDENETNDEDHCCISTTTIDPQLASLKINSPEGQDYIRAMSAAANFAWVNRSCITHLIRQIFEQQFLKTAEEMEMFLVYDVSHNIARFEEHMVLDDIEGEHILKTLLVHRKGATRAFPPHHPLVSLDHKFSGQPVLIGGSMGTHSYVLAGTKTGYEEDGAFGSTCHGAGRALSRLESRRLLKYQDVLEEMSCKGISLKVASPHLISEEAPEAYKSVDDVVEACTLAGISRRIVKLRPIAVIKG